MDSEDGYMILHPLGVEYTAKWYLESYFQGSFKNQKESNKDYSLLNLEGFEHQLPFDKLSPEEIISKLKGYKTEIKIYKDIGEDVGYDMLAYDLKRKIEITSPDFFNTILAWEKTVRNKATKLGVNIVPKVEIFVKVFIFIKLGYTTKFKNLAELFSMPLNLYLEFDKLYDPANLKL